MRPPSPPLTAARALLLLALAAGSALIARGSVAYFDPEEIAPFVLEKLPLADEARYLLTLQVHVVAAAFALPGCLALVSTTLLRRLPRLHRWLGRLVGGAVVFALVPSGFALSLHATGGLPSTLGFVATGAITLVAMVQGVRTARARRFAEHRRWVWHVLAQLSVAVTSRALLLAFDAAAVDPERAYVISLWLPVVGSALIVEALTRTTPLSLPWRTHAPPAAAVEPRPVQPVPRGATS
jgi:hypothetical protein